MDSDNDEESESTVDMSNPRDSHNTLSKPITSEDKSVAKSRGSYRMY